MPIEFSGGNQFKTIYLANAIGYDIAMNNFTHDYLVGIMQKVRPTHEHSKNH